MSIVQIDGWDGGVCIEIVRVIEAIRCGIVVYD